MIMYNCVEIFLAPYGNKKDCYHIIINAAGITYDAFAGNRLWGSMLRKAVRRNKDSWTVEAAIPLRSLGIVLQAGDIWQVNVGREEKPNSELSSMCPKPGSFSKNLVTGQFRIPANGVSLAAINFEKSSKLKLNIDNPEKQNGKYYVEIKAVDDKDKVFESEKEVSIKVAEKAEVEIPYPGILRLFQANALVFKAECLALFLYRRLDAVTVTFE